MFVDLSPLKNNAEFRKLFTGQTVSFFGSMMSYVAIPYQTYEITKSSFLVGLISSVQLVPLLIAGLYGGALADMVDRRKLLLIAEAGLFITMLLFLVNSMLPNPSIVILMILAAVSSALVGLHRPAMDAIVPQLVEKKDLQAVAALGSLRYAIGAVAGPALAGVLIAAVGVKATYAIDALTFLISIWALWLMKPVPTPEALEKADLNSIKEGIRFAYKNPLILGTYLVDIVAMVFAMPLALFPQLAEEFNQKKHLGLLYAAMPIGAGVVSLFSKPLNKYNRHGAGVILAATVWGIFVTLMAFSPDLLWMSAALFMAGAADSVSAIYRSTIWNEVIPPNVRGRLGSLNMLSYMVGPLIGNMRAGSMAAITGTHHSILWGGVLCVIACASCIWIFPTFWNYRSATVYSEQ
ncbi:MAG: MFS transporter [Pseudobdellovibrio sp.]|nr:MFS transporter [Pseudobdellovibrio sp.]